jgi:hypothetical protein
MNNNYSTNSSKQRRLRKAGVNIQPSVLLLNLAAVVSFQRLVKRFQMHMVCSWATLAGTSGGL